MHPMHASGHCTVQSCEVPVPEIYISMKQNGYGCGSSDVVYGLRKPSTAGPCEIVSFHGILSRFESDVGGPRRCVTILTTSLSESN